MQFKKEIEINTSPKDLAGVFINWGSDEQANFINLVGELFKKADFNAELQCCYVSDNITKFGRDFIYTMANFIKVKKFKDTSPHFNRLINTYDGDTLM